MIYDSVTANISLYMDLVEFTYTAEIAFTFISAEYGQTSRVALDWTIEEVTNFCDRVKIELPDSYFETEGVDRGVSASCNLDDHIFNVSQIPEEPIYEMYEGYDIEILTDGVMYDMTEKALNTIDQSVRKQIREVYVDLLGFPVKIVPR